MKCLIIDDEPIAIQVLQTHLARIPDVEVVATCQQALKAFDILQSQHVDLLFLDIEMPELTGLEFLRALTRPPSVILTTAYREYALEGFELDVLDYLLKPISFPRLLRALDKAKRTGGHALPDVSASQPPLRTLALPVDRRTVSIPLDDILYIESISDYVKVHTQEEHIVSKQRLSDLAERLSSHQFVRIHRSFVISMRHVWAYSAEDVQVGDVVLPISRSYRQRVVEQLAERNL
ncbi:MAG: LytTR family DNA-binding domain-containing protein [Rhodothermales bacterium]